MTMTFSTDMLASPAGNGFTRFKLSANGGEIIDFSADDRKIEKMEAEAKAVLRQHGADALRRRAARDFRKAAQAALQNQDTDGLLQFIVQTRVADGKPCRFSERTLN